MLKKHLAVILSILMALSLFTACGAGATSSAPANSSQESSEKDTVDTSTLTYEYSDEMLAWAEKVRAEYEGTTLNMAGYAHSTLEAIKPMLPDFEALTGIKVEISETDIAKSHDRVVLDFNNPKSTYDIIMVPDANAPEYIGLGFLEPLNDYVDSKKGVSTEEWFDLEDISFAYRDLYMDLSSTNLYAVPMGGETGIMYYRKDIFDEYGFEVPETTDEMLKLAQKITEMNLEVDGQRVYGVSFRGRPALGGANWLFQIYDYAFGGQIVDPSNDVTPTVNSAESVEAVRWLTEMCKVGVPGIAAFDPNDAINQFRNGMAAMCLEASVFGADTEDPEISNVAGKVGYAPFPAGPAGSYNAVFGIAFGISTKSENKDAAWALIEWISSRGNQNIYLDNNGPVGRDSGLSDPELQAKYPFYQSILEAGHQASDLAAQGLRPTPKIVIALQYINAYAVNVSAALSGEVTPEESMELLQADMEKIAKDAGLI